MHYRWRRGFFRMWVVTSALWLLTCVGVSQIVPAALAELHAARAARTAALDKPLAAKGPQPTIDFEALEKQRPPTQAEVDQAKADFDAVIEASDEPQARADFEEAARAFLLLGLIPPAGLLGLGLALAWALAGFAHVPRAGARRPE